ncbi:aspartyl/asparaginyl beta-hydroxylase domain-containing protein [Hyalangium gracile]|uniref:aspartyl/asparaginyl beta-hydroxylase domain-containing protein n=1 Tax=Hyalangium gracile TaxID=394092 RepID=UPI001CD00F2B|nr:aspartyl/asparaginyl beta-hydroxylase domain-containing protein [Hyalangium gracile]
MTTSLSPEVRLPITYDADALRSALDVVVQRYGVKSRGQFRDGSEHPNFGGLSLHSIGGRWEDLTSGYPALAGFQETELVRTAPYFKHVLDSLKCPKFAVRLHELGPQGVIEPHSDDLGFDKAMLRLHVPIIPSPDVVFLIDGHRCRWGAGELWFGDFSRRHSVHNQGKTARVHLVVDVGINDFVLGLFPEEYIRAQPRIMRYPSAIPTVPSELKKLECSFSVSGAILGMSLPEVVPLEWGQRDRYDIDVHLSGERLVLGCEGRDAIALEAIGERKFRMLGGPTHLAVSFDVEPGTGRAGALHLSMGDQDLALPVGPLRAAA